MEVFCVLLLAGYFLNSFYVSLDTSLFGQGQYSYGSEAIYKLFDDFYCDFRFEDGEINGNPKITELISILEICDIIIERLSDSAIADKRNLYILTKHQFIYRIYPRLNPDTDALNKYHCDSCKKAHGLPKNMIVIIKRIIKNTKGDNLNGVSLATTGASL